MDPIKTYNSQELKEIREANEKDSKLTKTYNSQELKGIREACRMIPLEKKVLIPELLLKNVIILRKLTLLNSLK